MLEINPNSCTFLQDFLSTASRLLFSNNESNIIAIDTLEQFAIKLTKPIVRLDQTLNQVTHISLNDGYVKCILKFH